MTRIRALLVGFVGLSALFGVLGIAPASAPADAAHPTVGTYTIYIDWNNGGYDPPGTMVLNSDHTATVLGISGPWMMHYGKITMNVGGGLAIFHGKKTATGLNSLNDPGKAFNNFYNYGGVWYAVYTGP